MENATIVQIIEASDSFQAILMGTMTASIVTLAFYLIQFRKLGRLVRWIISHGKYSLSNPESTQLLPTPLLSVHQSIDSFIFGMSKVFPALILLALAWACGDIMQDVGADRLFAMVISDSGMSYHWLPTLSFVMSVLISLATGTSWGTMTIMFPLMVTKIGKCF